MARKPGLVPAQAREWLSFPIDDDTVRAIAARVRAWLEAGEDVRTATRAALIATARERFSWEGVAAGVVAAAGIIGFVGLIVPHALRLAFGPDHRALLPLSVVYGGVFMVAADLAAHGFAELRERDPWPDAPGRYWRAAIDATGTDTRSTA